MFWITPGSASHQAGWRQHGSVHLHIFTHAGLPSAVGMDPRLEASDDGGWGGAFRQTPRRRSGWRIVSPRGSTRGGVEKHLTCQPSLIPDRQKMSHCIDNRVVVVGFREEPASGGEVALFEDCCAGGNNQPDRRPPIVYVMGELDAVHRARHLNIGEHQIDIVSRFKDADCLVRIACLQRFLSRRYHQIDRTHPNDRAVFDDQDDRLAIFHHSLS